MSKQEIDENGCIYCEESLTKSGKQGSSKAKYCPHAECIYQEELQSYSDDSFTEFCYRAESEGLTHRDRAHYLRVNESDSSDD